MEEYLSLVEVENHEPTQTGSKSGGGADSYTVINKYTALR